MKNIPVIVDTREKFEFQMSHVEGAINITPEEFMSGKIPASIAGLAKDQAIILYCRSGQRSNTCAMILHQYGFTNLINGINEHRVAQMLKD